MHSRATRVTETRRRTSVGDRRAAVASALLEIGKRRVQPFEKSGSQHRLGAHEIELLEPGQARQQIEVRRPEAVGIGQAIGHRDDDAPQRTRPTERSRAAQSAQRVLRRRSLRAVDQRLFVAAIGRGEKHASAAAAARRRDRCPAPARARRESCVRSLRRCVPAAGSGRRAPASRRPGPGAARRAARALARRASRDTPTG